MKIGSGNGLSPVRCQAIPWTNTDLLSIRPLGKNFSELQIKYKVFIHKNGFENIVCKMAALSSRGRWVNNYIPRYPKDWGMLWFYVEAARRPPPAARRPQWCWRDNSKTTGWIVLKFGIHIGSDSVLTWLTFQGRRSKVKVTASENDVIFSTFLNFHFLSHFPPKPNWGGHSNTPPAIVPPCHSFARPSVRPFVRQ